MPAHVPAHVERLPLAGRDHRAQVGRLRFRPWPGRRRKLPVARQVGEVGTHRSDRFRLVPGQEMPHAGDRAVHPRAAHLLQRGVLADDHLDHPRAAQVHRGVAVDHRDEIAERRDIGAAGGRRPEQGAHLRDGPRRAHLGVEDLPGAAAAREHLHLIGDPGTGRVDQVDHRQAVGICPLDHANDLLDGARAPRPGLHGGVVGHQGNGPAIDRRGARDHPVGRQAGRQHVGEGAVLGEAARVGQQLDPVPGKQLAARRRLLVVTLGAAAGDPGPDLGKIRMGYPLGARREVSAPGCCCFVCSAHAGERTTGRAGTAGVEVRRPGTSSEMRRAWLVNMQADPEQHEWP